MHCEKKRPPEMKASGGQRKRTAPAYCSSAGGRQAKKPQAADKSEVRAKAWLQSQLGDSASSHAPGDKGVDGPGRPTSGLHENLEATGHDDGGQAPRTALGDRAVPLLGNSSFKASAATAAVHKGLVMDLALAAYESEGLSAFESPRSHAALHEAGHAVIGTADGRTISSIRVNTKICNNAKAWYGFTKYKTSGIQVGAHTSPENDFLEMRQILAGITAEALFADDFRGGSSLDETALGQIIAGGIVAKTGVDADSIFQACVLTVAHDLWQNKPAFDAIVAALCRNTILRGAMLRPLQNARKYSPDFEEVIAHVAMMRRDEDQ